MTSTSDTTKNFAAFLRWISSFFIVKTCNRNSTSSTESPAVEQPQTGAAPIPDSHPCDAKTSSEHSETGRDSVVSDTPYLSEAECRHIAQRIHTQIEQTCYEKTFYDIFLHFVEKNADGDEVLVYKKAGIDRRTMSKIRSKRQHYTPTRKTIFLLILALHLTVKEAEELLSSAGYSFRPNSTFDAIVRSALENKLYEPYRIDQILFEHHCETISSDL